MWPLIHYSKATGLMQQTCQFNTRRCHSVRFRIGQSNACKRTILKDYFVAWTVLFLFIMRIVEMEAKKNASIVTFQSCIISHGSIIPMRFPGLYFILLLVTRATWPPHFTIFNAVLRSVWCSLKLPGLKCRRSAWWVQLNTVRVAYSFVLAPHYSRELQLRPLKYAWYLRHSLHTL